MLPRLPGAFNESLIKEETPISEKEKIIKSNSLTYVLIKDLSKSDRTQYMGLVRPNNNETYFFNPVNANGEQRLRYTDLASLLLGPTVSSLLREPENS
ncbi:MAG: hypothetical protein WC781_02250 [Candidatus Pacearchaeota archaeon]|jgi:hypothetical protein